MAKRREPGQKEFSPLDDPRGRLSIDSDLIRSVTSPVPAPSVAPERAHLTVVPSSESSSTAVREVHASTTEAPLQTETPPRPIVGRQPTVEKLVAYNKFLTTPTEKLELDRLAAHVSGALGVSVKSSQLIRACLVLLLRSEGAIIRRAEGQPPFKRPSNTEAVALAEFDQLLAGILSQAFRDAGPLKPKM